MFGLQEAVDYQRRTNPQVADLKAHTFIVWQEAIWRVHSAQVLKAASFERVPLPPMLPIVSLLKAYDLNFIIFGGKVSCAHRKESLKSFPAIWQVQLRKYNDCGFSSIFKGSKIY